MKNFPIFTLKIKGEFDHDQVKRTRDSWNEIMRSNPEYLQVPLVIMDEGIELGIISLDDNDELVVCEYCRAINYVSSLECRKCGSPIK